MNEFSSLASRLVAAGVSEEQANAVAEELGAIHRARRRSRSSRELRIILAATERRIVYKLSFVVAACFLVAQLIAVLLYLLAG